MCPHIRFQVRFDCRGVWLFGFCSFRREIVQVMLRGLESATFGSHDPDCAMLIDNGLKTSLRTSY